MGTNWLLEDAKVLFCDFLTDFFFKSTSTNLLST